MRRPYEGGIRLATAAVSPSPAHGRGGRGVRAFQGPGSEGYA
jgi:hypothetical protein